MRRLLLLLLLLSLGCIQESAAPARDYGVIIKAFEPDVSEVKTGNQVSVRLQVENDGDFDAENVKAWIFNCGDFTNCGSTMEFHTLSKADLKASLPGESKDAVWKISSDRLMSENERLVQDVGVKVAYDYYSSAVAEIPVVSEDRYKELERLGKLTGSKVESSLSPVSVKITSPGIVVGSEQFAVKLDFEKTSDGFVAGCGGKTGCIDSVKIVPGPGLLKVSGGCDDATNFNLWRSGSASMTCLLKADSSCGSECHPTVKVTAKYRFVVEKSVSVTIIGTGGAVPPGPGPIPPTPALPSIALSPSSAKVGEDVTVSGSGYPASTDTTIYLEGTMWYENAIRITEAQTVRKLDAVPAAGFSPGASAGSVKTDGTGSFKAKIKLPFDSVPGTLHVYAIAEGTYPTTDFINSIRKPIELRKVAYIESVSKTSLKIGDTGIVVKGNGFAPNEDNINAYLALPGMINKPAATHKKLVMSPSGSGIAGSTPGSLKASSSGYIEGSFTVPAASANDYSIYAFGSQVGSAYTVEQALNGRKIITIEFDVIPSDFDKDGVEDLSDDCPNTPIGIPVDSRGCPLIFVSMIGSGTCDYKANGNADIVLRVKNSASSRIYDVYGFIKDSTSSTQYRTNCVARTFEPGEEFDMKGIVTGLSTGRHEITGIIYAGSALKEINRTEGLAFDVPSNDCPTVKITSAAVTPDVSTLSNPVTIDMVVKNTGTRNVDRLNVSVTWTLLPDGRVLGRDECVMSLAAGAQATCSKTKSDFTLAGLYSALVRVKEIRGPADIVLAEDSTPFQKNP